MGTVVWSTSTPAPVHPGHPRHTETHRVGKCTGCGSVEVLLDNPTGSTDLSGIGESATYPTGYGCEVCS